MNADLPFATRVATRAQRWVAAPPGEQESHLAKRAFLDTIGVAVAAWRLPSARILAEILELDRCGGDGRIIGSKACSSPAGAALMNGLLGHAQLFDDNSDPMIAHPSAPLVAVALALGPCVQANGAALIAAYAAGFDTSVLLGRLFNPEHYEHGWHATATIGVFGATIAAATLLACSVEETAHALGLAASHAAGLRQNFGSMAMGLHVGNAARAAVESAQLARGGFTASRQAFEGKAGYFSAFGPPQGPLAVIETGEHELVRSGIQFKFFASGAPTLCAIEAALELAPQIDGSIEAVSCDVDPWYEKTLKEDEPRDGYEAKVNLRYCVATALARGRVTLDDFEGPNVADPAVHALMKRISVRIDSRLTGKGRFPARVTVRANGRELRAERSFPRGAPENPPTDGELVDKFTTCVSEIASEPEARATAAQILELDRYAGSALYDLLACSPLTLHDGQSFRV